MTVNDDLIALKMLLDKIGIPIQLNSFLDRLKLQKAVYLIQLTGIDLGYRFSWYIRGPYSSELTKDLFNISSNLSTLNNIIKKYSFSDDIKPLIRKSKKLLEKPSNINLSDAEWYELLASLHYLKHIAFIPNAKNKDFEEVYKALPGDKRKRFTRSAAEAGWKFLEKHNLIEHKEIPAI